MAKHNAAPAACEPYPRPLCTVDVIILTLLDATLQVLLVQREDAPGEPFPGRWALPGGIVDTQHDRSLEDCARRKLLDKTGVVAPHLEQIGSWGDAVRDPRGWSTTHVYLALLPAATLHPRRGGNAADLRWFPLEPPAGGPALPPLAFDHARLLGAGLARLRGKAEYTSLPIYLLPQTFTLSELQAVFQVVLGRSLEKKAFRTRILASGLVEELDEMKETSRRPARLYRRKTDEGLHYFPRALESHGGSVGPS
ncbi:NUDIX hydrolase [Aromatoleum evansii]|uniref:NUDIX hydrolase n=1 Tax=Aromatoleum evansii TaxID=59406 RepID=UPI00145EF4D2|nr:NUDIX domain-containing protein [Aromatoleum evansii]NMG27965.1 NUDIX domain-containing protein [Aromatoleum evansii]